jgi:hypothetical protein
LKVCAHIQSSSAVVSWRFLMSAKLKRPGSPALDAARFSIELA